MSRSHSCQTAIFGSSCRAASCWLRPPPKEPPDPQKQTAPIIRKLKRVSFFKHRCSQLVAVEHPKHGAIASRYPWVMRRSASPTCQTRWTACLASIAAMLQTGCRNDNILYMAMRSALLIFLIGLFVIPSSATRAEKRVALIVGISRYQQVPQLGNPVRDSEAMAALFKRAGFDVVDNQRDLGVAELRRALRQFSEVSRDADIAVVYYAG